MAHFFFSRCGKCLRTAVRLRTGLVLAADGGLLSRLLVPFELGLGGRIGSGRQWLSWIHRDDLCRLIVHCLADPALSGPVNATAPVPVTNSDFTAALAKTLHRPAWLPVPAAPLRLALGDFADELLLGGQRVLPTAALLSGFCFRYADIDAALANITGARPAAPAPCWPVSPRYDDATSLQLLRHTLARFARSLEDSDIAGAARGS